MVTIRITSEFTVDKGDPNKIVQVLNKLDNRKMHADYGAHVLAATNIEGVELVPVGGFVHLHDHDSTGQCNTEIKEATTYLPDFD